MSRRRPSRTGTDTPETVTAPAGPVTTPAPAATRGDQPCPGPCNTAFRRAEDAAVAETARAQHHHQAHGEDRPCDIGCVPNRAITGHDTPFHPGKPVWCVDVHAFNDKGEMLDRLEHRGCAENILDDLSDLPDLATWLTPGKLNTPRDTEIDKSSSKGGGGARAMAHAPSPSPGWDTADELVRWLVSLEDWLRTVVGDKSGPAGVVSVFGRRHRAVAPARHRTLTDAVDYLTGHGTQLLSSSDAEKIGRGILATHRRLERLVGQDRLTHRITEPCPRCGRKAMRRQDGKELVKCGSCRAVWDWEHFQFLAHAYAQTVKTTGGAAS